MSFVLGIVGSILGCGVAYVLPGYLNMKQMKIRKKKGLKNEGKDVLLSHVAVLVGLGECMCVYLCAVYIGGRKEGRSYDERG